MTGTEDGEHEPSQEINPRQRALLRRLGNPLKPTLLIGKEGLSESLAKQLEGLLRDHELVKVKLLNTVTQDRHEMAEELAKASRSALVQLIGRTVLLYRKNRKAPRIQLDGLGEGD